MYAVVQLLTISTALAKQMRGFAAPYFLGVTMEFPNLVYRCPGTYQCPGGTFAYKSVQDEVQLAKALAEGWFATLPEAIEGKKVATETETPDSETEARFDAAIAPETATLADCQAGQQEAADNAPPTRAELQQKAKKLALKFDSRTSDKKLGDMITTALKG